MTELQRPLGPKDFDCPLWRKPMCDVCHKCPWWTLAIGTNPQTGEYIHRWECAIPQAILLLAENAKEIRQGAAAIESHRNVMAELGNIKKRQVIPRNFEVAEDGQITMFPKGGL